jgi:bacteriochlorophyll 4-vinyl reductase
MRDVGVGRVLVASLHQGIADVLPTRLGFYENWLNAEGLRDGTIGVAPLSAVLSFLRQEGEPYDQIMRVAGEYAADWTVDSMAPVWRGTVAALPTRLRARLLLGVAGRIVRSSYHGSRVRASVRKSVARVEVRNSILCVVRDPVPQPLCRYYAAAYSRVLARFELPAVAAVSSCRATEPAGSSCTLTIPLRPAPASAVEGAHA